MKRVAIARIAMRWSIQENVKAILWTVELAHSQGAQLCGFSELALTGFHREIAKTALLDRLTHHCSIVETGNESFRFLLSTALATKRIKTREQARKAKRFARKLQLFEG